MKLKDMRAWRSAGLLALLLAGCEDEAKGKHEDPDAVEAADGGGDEGETPNDSSEVTGDTTDAQDTDDDAAVMMSDADADPVEAGRSDPGTVGADADAAAARTDAAAAARDSAASDAGGTTQTHTGRFWFTLDYCWLNSGGTLITDLVSKRTTMQENEIDDVVPASHGKWYVYRTRPTTSTTTYGLVDGASWELIARVTIDGRLTVVRPAPHDSKLISGFYYLSGKTTRIVVLDLTTGKVALEVQPKTFPAGVPSSYYYQALAWMPDGRFLLLYGNGERALGSMDGTLEALPSVTFPQGYTLGSQAWVSPDGNSYTVQLLRKEGDTSNSDIWIGSVRGAELARLTRTNASTLALWSPDGGSIVFDVDPDFTVACNGGLLDQYHDSLSYIVPADARGVSSGTLIDKYTGTRGTGMKLLGWTP